MAPRGTIRNIFMDLRKVCQHPYLSQPDLEDLDLPEEEQQKQLVNGCGKLLFLKMLLPKLKAKGHRILLFSQFKIALDRIEDFCFGEGYKFLRLDGDVQQAQRQKSMDAFNAANSDFFIFLLTTRAGGVGINLATADTVIVYDPDFNPHMDLQAIARSHRYGQKKKVMVFKLMMKNSVEERIMQAGKKKMVLDHLVVQQMGKENEEGNIDNMLLHGAAALYEETSANGMTASDVQYTSKDIDELIERVEKDAEVEAQAQQDRWDAQEKGEVEVIKPKETMEFGFAKIWEAKQERFQEINENEEDRPEETVTAWEMVMENAQKERRRKDAEELEARAKRSRKAAMYEVDDLTPEKKKGKGKKGQGKGKGKDQDKDDEEAFVNVENGTESEGEDSIRSFQEDLLPVVNGQRQRPFTMSERKIRKMAPGPLKSELERHALAARAALEKSEMAQSGPSNGLPFTNGHPSSVSNGNGSHTNAAAGPSVPQLKIPKETPEERAARKAKRKEEKAAVRAAFVRQHRDQKATPNGGPMLSTTHPNGSLTSDQFTPGRNVLGWMFHLFRERGPAHEIDRWGIMALPEVPIQERQNLYRLLAAKADAELQTAGYAPFFAVKEQYDAVMVVFSASASGIPDAPVEPPVPKVRRQHPHSPRTSQPPPLMQASPPRPIAAPAAPRPDSATAAGHGPANAATSASPDIQSNGHSSSATAAALVPARDQCTYCQGPHSLRDCTTITPIGDLMKYCQMMLDSNEPDAEKKEALDEIQVQLDLYADAGIHPEPEGQVNGHGSLAVNVQPGSDHQFDPPLKPEPSFFQNGTESPKVNGHAPKQNGHGRPRASETSDIIVIEDDSDEDGRPGKKRKSNGHTNGSSPINHKSRTRLHRGCQICDSSHEHPAKACPVVKAGPESIMEAMRKCEPSSPMWPVLRKLWAEQVADRESSRDKSATVGLETCYWCSRPCGRNLRDCIELNGDRKALKERIRGMATEPLDGGRIEDNPLYICYLQWPKPAKQ